MKPTKVNPSQIELKAGFGFDPAWTDEEAALHAGLEDGSFYRWSAWKDIAEMETAYRAGDNQVLLDAINICARHQLPMPEWVAAGWKQSYTKWKHYEVKTLDNAFNVERRGKHLSALRKHSRLKSAIPYAIFKEIEAGKATDEELFDAVGKRFGIGGPTARDIFYKNKDAVLKTYRRFQKND